MPQNVYQWQEQIQSYRNVESGAEVPPSDVRAAIDAYIESAKQGLAGLSQDLRAGKLTLGEWQAGMMDGIKELHLANGAAAAGGWDQMDFRDFGRVGHEIRDQYGYLSNFAQQLADGTQALDGPSFLNRTDLYGEASRRTYEDVSRAGAVDAGMGYERSVLGVADHCEDCLDAASQGWQPIGELSLPGDRQCGPNCKCELEQSDTRGDEGDAEG